MTLDEQIESVQNRIVAGELRLGMTRTEVKDLLGVPDDVGMTSCKYRTPRIFLYGKIEYHFGPRAKDGLVMVYTEDAKGDGITILIVPGAPPKPT